MRVLLDECVPQSLGEHLLPHDVCHVRDMGWAGKKNGELLKLMAPSGFDVLLTVDQNLPFQQNLRGASVAVIVLVGASTKIPDLLPLLKGVHLALGNVKPGDFVEIRS